VQIDFSKPEMIHSVVWDQGSSVPAEYEIKVLDEDTGQWKKVADTADRLPRENDARKPDQFNLRGLSNEEVAFLVKKVAAIRSARRELSRLSSGPQVFAARFSDTPDATWLLRRGDPMQRTVVVPPAIPKVLGDLGLAVDEPEANRRLALAQHLTDDDHPLTARVMVNRVWQHHFGEGLVDTPSDFGAMGSRPAHPRLLDHLAAEFVTDGWSLKRLHRKIVLSRTFRQSSRPRSDALLIDADSRLLWRFPPRRLEAEAIRDSDNGWPGVRSVQAAGRFVGLYRDRNF
jgi:hypothetical protein